jgi:hypothetical protein
VRGAEVLAVVPVRAFGDAEIALTGRWRSVLDAREHDLSRGERVTELAGDWPVVLLERA